PAPPMEKRKGPLGGPGDRAGDLLDFETRRLRMALQGPVRKQDQVLGRVPLVPEVSPESAPERGNIGCLPNQDSARRKDLPNRFQNTAGMWKVFDDVEKMNSANASWLNVPTQRRLIALMRFNTASP